MIGEAALMENSKVNLPGDGYRSVPSLKDGPKITAFVPPRLH